MTPREDIYQALFDLIKRIEGIKTSSRRLRHWSDVVAADQPALFMAQKGETATVQTNVPAVWNFRCDLWLYANTGGDMKQPPMTDLNPIVDAIVDKLLPPAHIGEQTLGGLVTRCRIDGAIETDEGILGDQAVVIIPVNIFVPQ